MSNNLNSIPKSSTLLFHSIKNRCWDDVVLQVTDYPEITKQWIAFPREENIVPSFPQAICVPCRRLPLHEALIHKAPHKVIICLLRACPEAAKEPDDNGRLPLHYAAYYGATVDCMMDLILAFPEALVDHKPHDALHLARHFKNSNNRSTMGSLTRDHKSERITDSNLHHQQQYIEELEQQIDSLTNQYNDVYSCNKDQATLITDLLQQVNAVTNKYDELFATSMHVQRAKKHATRQVEQLLSEKRLLEAKVSIEHESATRTLEEMHVKIGQFAIKYWECSKDTSNLERVKSCENALEELLKVSPTMKALFASHRKSLGKTSHQVTELEQQVAMLVQQIEDFFSSDTIKIQPYEYNDDKADCRQSPPEHIIPSEMEKLRSDNEGEKESVQIPLKERNSNVNIAAFTFTDEALVAGTRVDDSQIFDVNAQYSNRLSVKQPQVNHLSECATDLNFLTYAGHECTVERCRNPENENSRITYLEEQITSFINKCDELFQENALKSQAYNDAAMEVERLAADKKSALKSLNEATRKNSFLEAQLASLERQNHDISLRWAEKTQECKEAFKQLEIFSASKELAENKIKEEYNLDISDLKERNIKLSMMYDKLLSENQIKSLAFDEANAQLKRLSNEKNGLIKSIDIARHQIAVLQSKVRVSLEKMDKSTTTGEESCCFNNAEESKGIFDDGPQLDISRMKQEARDDEEATNHMNVTDSKLLNTTAKSLKPVASAQVKIQAPKHKLLNIEAVDVSTQKDDSCMNSGYQNTLLDLNPITNLSGDGTTDHSSPSEVIEAVKAKAATYQIISKQSKTSTLSNGDNTLPMLDVLLKHVPVDKSEVIRSNIDLECQISILGKDVEALMFHTKSTSQAYDSVNLLVHHLSAEKDLHIKNSKDALSRCAYLEQKLTALVQNNNELLVENNITVKECKESLTQMEMVAAQKRLVEEKDREEATLGISEIGGQIRSLNQKVESLSNVAVTATEASKEDKRKWKELYSQMRSMENNFEKMQNSHSLHIQNLLREITERNSEAVLRTADTELQRIEYGNNTKLLKSVSKTEKQNAKLIEKMEYITSCIDSLLKTVSDSKKTEKKMLVENDISHEELVSAHRHLLTCIDEMNKSRKEIFDLVERNLSISSESQSILGDLKSIVDSKAGISEVEIQLRNTNELLKRSLEGKEKMEHKLEILQLLNSFLPSDTCSLMEQVVQTKASNASLATELERVQTELKTVQTKSSIDICTTAAHALKYYEKTFSAMRELRSQIGESQKLRNRIDEPSSLASIMAFLRWKGYNPVKMLVSVSKAARLFISNCREKGIYSCWLLVPVFIAVTCAGKAILKIVFRL